MSTFKGFVKEFPSIRIDYFRTLPERPSPLACFLSHVHSDHLVGLDSFKSPFIYCSPATREILLKLEKYPHRINFAKGILESRKQTYKHLAKLLRPIPLNTPTMIELSPSNKIQVTLLDANHCVGAVMFLIQDPKGKAILYTGDVRSESSFIHSILHNPLILPYERGLRDIDCLYLDTTFATKQKIHHTFPDKAPSIATLIGKIMCYPATTVFHLPSWTFGYENVWIALWNYFGEQIHVDDYQHSLYMSLNRNRRPGEPEPPEAAALCGFTCGNDVTDGCLTTDPDVRFHICEYTEDCPALSNNETVVTIIPVISFLDGGGELREVGAGGGGGDTRRGHELDLPDVTAMNQLRTYLQSHLGKVDDVDQILDMVEDAKTTGSGKAHFDSWRWQSAASDNDIGICGLDELLRASLKYEIDMVKDRRKVSRLPSGQPRTIYFPYSRHSSYSELRNLVRALIPKDIHACTVNEAEWTPKLSMEHLFGDVVDLNTTFTQDRELMQLYKMKQKQLKKGRGIVASQHQSQSDYAGLDDILSSESEGLENLSRDQTDSLGWPESFDSQETESPPQSPLRRLSPPLTGAPHPSGKGHQSSAAISISSDDGPRKDGHKTMAHGSGHGLVLDRHKGVAEKTSGKRKRESMDQSQKLR